MLGAMGDAEPVARRVYVTGMVMLVLVIFAMAVGMGVGAGYPILAAISIPVMTAVGLLARLVGRTGGPLATPPADAVLDLRLKSGSGAELDLPAALAKFGTNVRLVASGTPK